MTDPYRILGVTSEADDDTIRAAYLAAVRACPPERDAARFEQVRAAYETIGTAGARLAHALFDATIPSPEDMLSLALDGAQARDSMKLDQTRLLRVMAGK